MSGFFDDMYYYLYELYDNIPRAGTKPWWVVTVCVLCLGGVGLGLEASGAIDDSPVGWILVGILIVLVVPFFIGIYKDLRSAA